MEKYKQTTQIKETAKVSAASLICPSPIVVSLLLAFTQGGMREIQRDLNKNLVKDFFNILG